MTSQDLSLDIVCDFDGTLVDTKKALYEAYKYAANGTPPPKDFFGKPWQKWCAPAHKLLKDQIYPEYAKKYARLTKLGEGIDWSQITILTGASGKGYEAVMQALFPNSCWPEVLQYRCDPIMKRQILLERNLNGKKHGIYLDDMLSAGLIVTQMTSYDLGHVDLDKLRVVKRTGKELWIPSYSQPELMNGLKVLYQHTTNPS